MRGLTPKSYREPPSYRVGVPQLRSTRALIRGSKFHTGAPPF